MEGLRFENSLEQAKNIIKLDHENLQYAGWGRPVLNLVPEAIKIFGIIRFLKEKNIPKDKIYETAQDLFDQFDVELYDFEDVFSKRVITQIANIDSIDALEIDLNNNLLLVTPQSTVESVTADFEKASAPSAEQLAKWETKKNEDEKKIAEQQEIVDGLLANIDFLDFSNLENVIEWLYEYNKHCWSDVDFHEDELIKKFEEHGYSPEKNDKVDFMLGEALGDKKTFGEAMVGYMLQNISMFERGDQFRRTIDDWKKGIMKS